MSICTADYTQSLHPRRDRAALIKREMVDLRGAPGISHLISAPSSPSVSAYSRQMEAAAGAPDWRGEFLIKFALRVIRRAAAAEEFLYLSVKNRTERAKLSGPMMCSFVFMFDA